MGKLIVYNVELRKKILEGVKKLAKTVGVTMGPEGKNVILQQHIGAPTITKDGVTVARQVVLDDPIEELGCQLVKEVAGRTAAVAGDGTTTATVLAHEILHHGLELMDAGYSPLKLKYGMEWAQTQILSFLEGIASPINGFDDLKHIATISTNNDPVLGELIAQAYTMADGGMVMAQARPGVENHVAQVDGLEIKSGYISRGFIDKGKSKAELNNCKILICDREITHITDNPKLFDDLSQANAPLLIIAKDLKKEALKLFLQNNAHGRIRVCAIKLPTDGFGKFNLFQDRWLEDIAMQVGTVVVSEDRGVPLSEMTISDLGSAKQVLVDRYLTKIIEPQGNEEQIKARLEEYKEDAKKLVKDREKMDIDDRIANLKGKGTLLIIGYATGAELRQTGDRIDDAMFSVECALESGYVPGGGISLIRAANWVMENKLTELDEELRPAAEVLLRSCLRPFVQILRNADVPVEAVLNKVMAKSDPKFGYNVVEGKYGNLVKMGVIDPKKVTQTALINATSIANLLIRTEAAVADLPEKPEGWQPPAGYRMPSDTGYNHQY
nr:60 kDa chaperonin [bacterium]